MPGRVCPGLPVALLPSIDAPSERILPQVIPMYRLLTPGLVTTTPGDRLFSHILVPGTTRPVLCLRPDLAGWRGGDDIGDDGPG